jgi:mRNA interferase MazF
VLVVQANSFNRTRIQTVIVAVIASDLELADAPGNVMLPSRSTGFGAKRAQLLTLDRGFLAEHAGTLPPRMQGSIDAGLRAVLQL